MKEPIQEIQNKISKFLGNYIVLTILVLFVLGPFLGITKLGTYGLLPLLGIIALSHSIKKSIWIERKTELTCLILMLALCIPTAFFYRDAQAMTSTITSIGGSVLGGYCGLRLAKKESNYENYFFVSYILTIAGLILIMIYNGNFVIGLVNSSKSVMRDVFMVNANSYSYYSFFANFGLFILYHKYKTKTIFFLLILFPILFILTSFVTQSRTGLIYTVLTNIIFWIFINKTENVNPLKKIGLVLFSFCAIFVLIYQLALLLLKSDFIDRLDVNEGSSQERQGIVIEALNFFIENPIFGIGVGQYPSYSATGLFSHNSYMEAFSEQGILAGVLILIIFINPVIKAIKMFFQYGKSPEVKIQLLFFLTFALYNNFYVFYKFSFAMMFHFLMIAYQEKLIRKLELEDYNTINTITND
jgi:O-antigen ligase